MNDLNEIFFSTQCFLVKIQVALGSADEIYIYCKTCEKEIHPMILMTYKHSTSPIECKTSKCTSLASETYKDLNEAVSAFVKLYFNDSITGTL